MGRPCQSTDLLSRRMSKEKLLARKENEQKLRGKADKIKPSSYLNLKQKKIFRYIVNELSASEILSNLDIYILTTLAIAIDRLEHIENIINQDFNKCFDKNIMSAKKKYTEDLHRCSVQLCLNPQSRARISNINIETQKQNNDPLLKILNKKRN